MGDLGRYCLNGLKVIELFFNRDAVLYSLAVGLATSGLTYNILRKDDEFEEAVLYGFLGEFPKNKMLRINCPSGEIHYVGASRINERIKKNHKGLTLF